MNYAIHLEMLIFSTCMTERLSYEKSLARLFLFQHIGYDAV